MRPAFGEARLLVTGTLSPFCETWLSISARSYVPAIHLRAAIKLSEQN